MLRKVEWGFVVLLALSALGHTAGTFLTFDFGTGIFVWSLAAVLACALLVAINALSIQRPADKALRLLSIFGDICWLVIVALFAMSIGTVMDPRVLMHGIAALGLLVFAFKR